MASSSASSAGAAPLPVEDAVLKIQDVLQHLLSRRPSEKGMPARGEFLNFWKALVPLHKKFMRVLYPQSDTHFMCLVNPLIEGENMVAWSSTGNFGGDLSELLVNAVLPLVRGGTLLRALQLCSDSDVVQVLRVNAGHKKAGKRLVNRQLVLKTALAEFKVKQSKFQVLSIFACEG